MNLRRLIGIAGIVVACAWPLGASAGEFYKVYPYGTLEAGAVELVYFTTYVASSENEATIFEKLQEREGLVAHSFEVEYGLSHKFTVGAYVDLIDPVDGSLEYAKTKVVGRYRLFEKGSRPVDLALYAEYAWPDADYKDSETFEFKVIVEKDLGPVRVSLNPTFEKKTSGGDVEEGSEFKYAGGIYYDNYGMGLFSNPDLMIRPGLEFYGDVGEIQNRKDLDEQKHYLFPTLDIFLWQALHLNVGVGFGLTDAADDLVVKSIFSFEHLF